MNIMSVIMNSTQSYAKFIYAIIKNVRKSHRAGKRFSRRYLIWYYSFSIQFMQTIERYKIFYIYNTNQS